MCSPSSHLSSHWVRPLQPSTAPTHCLTASYPLQHLYNTLQHSTVYSSTAFLQSTTSTTPLCAVASSVGRKRSKREKSMPPARGTYASTCRHCRIVTRGVPLPAKKTRPQLSPTRRDRRPRPTSSSSVRASSPPIHDPVLHSCQSRNSCNAASQSTHFHLLVHSQWLEIGCICIEVIPSHKNLLHELLHPCK